MIFILADASLNRGVALALIIGAALFTLAMIAAFVMAVVRQHRNNNTELPKLEGFGEPSSAEEPVVEEEQSVFQLDDEEMSLPGSENSEGESFLQETRAAQAKQLRKERGDTRFALRRKK